ncbi:MAG: anti-ECFsigma factor, ChrR [Bryobacterales bacterium]|nr:anti-ECFsigma factor, ChrR [Bryobacterales bacterium]
MTHPKEHDLALFATRDLSFVQNFRLNRHVRDCAQCSQTVAEYRDLTVALAEPDLEIANWDALAAEMKANVRLGLEAGACIDNTRFSRKNSLSRTNPLSRTNSFLSRDRNGAGPATLFNPRLTLAAASLVVLVSAGLLMRQPRPSQPAPPATEIASQQSVKVDTEGVTITNVYLE